MPQYLIKAPCVYANEDGTCAQHFADAVDNTVVELTPETAASLGAAVEPLGVVVPDLAPEPAPEPRKRGKAPEPGEGGGDGS